ncbi:hypothetical protein NEHOM01_1653 [Nematocida homosporus]|uniref:uncharacterized protein n=1 Tax=Nematocida homosporus TaxID=1912981 RepID=UPI00222058F2|nr:uncharacterized protein NEHOM01_1653 [Nematocida homosporus]KAI5186714.1 hypothetical protein NEHOM01_1653 [Nematocida homosporus]
MLKRRNRAVFGVSWVIGLCLFILNVPRVISESEYEYLAKYTPSLDNLVDHGFIWAKETQQQHKGNRKFNKAKDEKFLTSEFYKQLGFEIKDLDRVKKAAARLNILFKSDPTGIITHTICPDDLMDIVLLYAVLNQSTGSCYSEKACIPEQHNLFVQNLAWHIHSYVTTPADIDELELAFLDKERYAQLTGEIDSDSTKGEKDESKNFRSGPKSTLTHNHQIHSLLNSTPLIDYIHPLNTAIYLEGFNYTYSDEPREFNVCRNTDKEAFKHQTNRIHPVARFTFESAVALRHAPANTDTIKVNDVKRKDLMNVLRKYQCSKKGSKKSKARKDQQKSEEGSDNRGESILDRLLTSPIITTLSVGVSLASVQFLAALLGILLATHDMAVWILPISILVCGLVSSLLLLFLNKPAHASFKPMRAWEYWLGIVFTLLLILATTALFALNNHQLTGYHETDGLVLFKVTVLGVTFALAAVVTLGFLIIQGLYKRRLPRITQCLSWALYVFSFLLAILVPGLVIFKLPSAAHILLSSHILVVSAMLFGLGSLIDIFGLRFRKDSMTGPAQNNHGARLAKIKLICMFVGLVIAVGFSIWANSNQNLLAEGIKDPKPIDSILTWFS